MRKPTIIEEMPDNGGPETRSRAGKTWGAAAKNQRRRALRTQGCAIAALACSAGGPAAQSLIVVEPLAARDCRFQNSRDSRFQIADHAILQVSAFREENAAREHGRRDSM